MPKIYGLILAGGFSKRMGKDKAFLDYHGKPQIEYVHDLLQNTCEKIFLSKQKTQPNYKNLDVINDAEEYSNIGPLGGILSAMKTHPQVSWCVVACDLPFITTETLEELNKHRDHKKIATAFKSNYEGFPEPLCSIWEGWGYPSILEFFKNDIRCPRKVLINSDIKLVKQKNPKWLDNVNTSHEFEEALKYVKSSSISS